METVRERGMSGVGRRKFHPADLCDRERNRFSGVVPILDVAFQVDVDEFEDKVELVVSMDDVKKPIRSKQLRDVVGAVGIVTDIALHDVLILELLEQTDFANGSARDAFVFCF